MALQSLDNDTIPTGTLRPGVTFGEVNNTVFLIQQVLSKIQTATLVQVAAVTNAGGLDPVGFVDVVPMVAQIDAFGKPTPHATIYKVPYVRLQGGTNAIIIDPLVGDIGLCVFASRDISKIKNSKARGVPGSNRSFNYADGIYIGGVLNGVPDNFIQFSPTGVNVTSTSKVTITAPEVDIVGTLKNNGVNVGSTHHHGGVTTGSGVTSGPA